MIPAISNFSIKLLSGLANNNDSLAPMVAKDFAGNCAVIATYSKEGTKEDVQERAIEDFGTGAIWLFAIPVIKKIIDKTVYPLLNLNPDFDIRLLKGKDDAAISDMAKTVIDAAKNNSALENEAKCFKDLAKNKNLYKGMFFAKFAVSTLLSAFALTKLIKYKQEKTSEKIKKDYIENTASTTIMQNKLNNSENYLTFTQKKSSNTPSFNGLLSAFAYNPRLNTSILDGVIAGVRLKNARKGEVAEVAFKEFYQMAFIYLLAAPVQKMFEKIGRKINTPIELDPQVLFDKDIAKKAQEAVKTANEYNLSESKDLFKSVVEIANKDINNPLIDLLHKNNTISLVKKGGKPQAISYMKHVEEADIKNAVSNIESLAKSLNDGAKMSSVKGYKAFSVLANIFFGIFCLGVVLPKSTIALRKFFNNGDNRNPAIANQQKELALNKNA